MKLLDRLSFFTLGIAAVGLSVLAWSTVFNYLSEPNMRIISWSIKTPVIARDARFSYQATYQKDRDCPGQWTIRATDDSGHIWQIDSGRLGAHLPGEYTVEWTIDLPDYLPAGTYQVNEVIDGICDSGVPFVARGPFSELRVK